MKLKFLGTGTAWSKAPENFNNNVLVQAGDDHAPWLIDCGTTAPQALKEMGLGVADFKGVFVTHLHGDHVFGLEETGFYNFFVLQRRVQLWLPEQLLSSRSGIEGEDLWENCLRGPMGTVQSYEGSSREVGLDDYFDVRFMKVGEPVEIEGVRAEIFSVDHVPNKPSFGIILNDHIAYTSDCIFRPELIQWLVDRGCDHIFHDAYFGPLYPGRVHTAYAELATLPESTRRRILLMHYNDSATEEDFDTAREAGFRIATRHGEYVF